MQVIAKVLVVFFHSWLDCSCLVLGLPISTKINF